MGRIKNLKLGKDSNDNRELEAIYSQISPPIVWAGSTGAKVYCCFVRCYRIRGSPSDATIECGIERGNYQRLLLRAFKVIDTRPIEELKEYDREINRLWAKLNPDDFNVVTHFIKCGIVTLESGYSKHSRTEYRRTRQSMLRESILFKGAFCFGGGSKLPDRSAIQVCHFLLSHLENNWHDFTNAMAESNKVLLLQQVMAAWKTIEGG